MMFTKFRTGWMILTMFTLIALPVYVLHDYLEFTSVNFLAGIATVGLSLYSYRGNPGRRFMWPLLVMAAVNFLLPVNTTFYLLTLLAGLYVLETKVGKVDKIVPMALFMMSPVMNYAVNSFSFPIRLWLTEVAGRFLMVLDNTTQVEGNVVVFNGAEYAVDAGCMGLSMVEVSLLLVLLLTVVYQRQAGRIIRHWQLLLALTCIFALNIIANLFRIILIVRFDLAEGTIGHELAGIACLLLYVFVPAVFLTRYFVKHGKAAGRPAAGVFCNKFSNISLVALSLLIGLLAIRTSTADTYALPEYPPDIVPGYITTNPVPGTLKISNDSTLIYLKYLRGWYDTDHNPMLCWKGSGFEFRNITQRSVNKHTYYSGLLVQGDQVLHSAWWYYDGNVASTDPWSWRLAMLKGTRYHSIINVSAESEDALLLTVRNILSGNLAKFYKPL